MGTQCKWKPIIMLTILASPKLLRSCFFRLCLKVFKQVVFFIDLGRLFHIERSMFDKPFSPILVFQKRILSLTSYFLILFCMEWRIHKPHSNTTDQHY